MTNLSFTLLQRHRLSTDTPVEQGIARARFARAGSTEETSECRAGDEYHTNHPDVLGFVAIKHPINFLWKICMGRNV
jgi:hypothetical protein